MILPRKRVSTNPLHTSKRLRIPDMGDLELANHRHRRRMLADLNEVALPSAAATEASHVVTFRPVDGLIGSHLAAKKEYSALKQAPYFQLAAIQIP